MVKRVAHAGKKTGKHKKNLKHSKHDIKKVDPSKVKSAKELANLAEKLGIKKPAKTHKGRKILERRAPRLVENTKKSVFMKGKKSSEVINTLMRELHTRLLLHRSQFLMWERSYL